MKFLQLKLKRFKIKLIWFEIFWPYAILKMDEIVQYHFLSANRAKIRRTSIAFHCLLYAFCIKNKNIIPNVHSDVFSKYHLSIGSVFVILNNKITFYNHLGDTFSLISWHRCQNFDDGLSNWCLDMIKTVTNNAVLSPTESPTSICQNHSRI